MRKSFPLREGPSRNRRSRMRVSMGNAALQSNAQPLSINALPVEVLDNVFAQFVNSHPPARSYLAALGFSPPVRLTHVCRRWREVAVSSPRLWTRIVLWDRYGGVAYSKELLEQDLLVLDTFTARSARLPLELFILHDYRSASRSIAVLTEYESVLHNRLIPAICSVVQRCRTIHIDEDNLEEEKTRALIMDAIKSSPAIEDLSVGISWHHRTYPDEALLVRLKALRMAMINPFQHLFTSLTSCGLRLLHIRDGITGVELLRLCHCLDHLEELEVKLFLENFLPGEVNEVPEMQMRTLPKLQSLIMTICAERSSVGPWTIFHRLQLPSLRSLEVTTRGSIHHEQVSTIAPFLSRSPALASLKFWGDQPPFPDVAIMFEKTPQLQQLSINWPTNDNETTGLNLVEFLVTTVAGPSRTGQGTHVAGRFQYCPRLERIELLGGMCDIITVDSIATLFKERFTVRCDHLFSKKRASREICPECYRLPRLREAKLEVRQPSRYFNHPDILRCCENGFRLIINDAKVSNQ